MKIKTGAVIAGLDIRMRPVLVCAEEVWRSHGQELVVTSGLDGEHSAGSLHYYGLALDLRTYYFDDPNVVADDLRELLAHERGQFKVIVEKTHIHVQYDGRDRSFSWRDLV